MEMKTLDENPAFFTVVNYLTEKIPPPILYPINIINLKIFIRKSIRYNLSFHDKMIMGFYIALTIKYFKAGAMCSDWTNTIFIFN